MDTRFFLAICLALLSFATTGEVYKWIDADGKVHYGDRLPQDASAETIKGEVNTVEHQRYDFLPPRAGEAAAAEAQVVMYATSWCGFCRQAREYFQSRDIPYTEYDIEKDEDANRDYQSLGGNGVPLILVGDRKMSGFTPESFENLYEG